jgi:NAD-dependent dihydropyrimidine dehydrogenase PreA subunit
MARVIDDDCINCGICEKFCPVGAISKGEKHMEVDKEKCFDCYACEIECPKKAAYFG